MTEEVSQRSAEHFAQVITSYIVQNNKQRATISRLRRQVELLKDRNEMGDLNIDTYQGVIHLWNEATSKLIDAQQALQRIADHPKAIKIIIDGVTLSAFAACAAFHADLRNISEDPVPNSAT